MSTSSTLKLALELAAKVTGREDLAALAGEVEELGAPLDRDCRRDRAPGANLGRIDPAA